MNQPGLPAGPAHAGGVRVVLAGGGSAGHVNPLLATADALRRADPAAVIQVLGTSEGLEARLVPERGYSLTVIPKVPFPRRPNATALRFPGRLRRAISIAEDALRECDAQVVAGFGGYVATPAYLAARRARIPVVIHEANARAGLANRFGARSAAAVATTFAATATSLPRATRLGLPLREEIRAIAQGDRERDRQARVAAREFFGLDPDRPTLLVFGGSLGAQRLNEAFAAAAADLAAAGIQVLHLTGAGKGLGLAAGLPVPYTAIEYSDRMELAYIAADLAVARSGAGTVCELAAVGLPAIYVPLPIGNGEQKLNASEVVAAGGGQLAEDSQVDAEWVKDTVIPLILDTGRVAQMGRAAAAHGERDADDQLAQLIIDVAGRGR